MIDKILLEEDGTTDGSGYESNAEKRRKVRRDMERGLISEQPDKFQMNDLMLGLLVIIAAVVSFTDFSFSPGDFKNLTAVTLFLYIITTFVYRNRYNKGMSRGRKDLEYKYALSTYREKREDINIKNLVRHVPAFCTYYKKTELKQYRESLLCDIEMDYEEYKEKYLKMSKKDILALPISSEAKGVILKCNFAKAIKLYPGMILNESGEYDREKIIGKSGREREKQDKKQQAVSRAVYVLFGAIVAFDMIFNFSLTTILQWIIRMLPVVLAVINGDDNGYCNVTVTETNFKRDQANVIDLFMDYANSNHLIEQQEADSKE